MQVFDKISDEKLKIKTSLQGFIIKQINVLIGSL
jgi:hypothetical protein